MSDECEKRVSQAIYGHVNMLLSGVIEALNDPNMVGPVLKLGIKRQFPILVERLGVERPKSIEQAVEIINKFGHDCKLKQVEPKDPDVTSLYKVVAVFEDDELDEAAIKRARENFGAITNISECIPLLLSRVTNCEKYDFILRLYKDEHGLYRARVYIIEKRSSPRVFRQATACPYGTSRARTSAP